jgi:hypothetical protein
MLSFGYLTLVSVFGIVCQVCGQTAVLSGTNYVSGSGFCFGDQQLKEGTAFISCTASGFTGEVDTYDIRWFINGGSDALIESEVQGMYPVIAVPTSEGESRLNITNVNSLGVSSVACRISADDRNGNQLGPAVRSASENISVVNTVPALEMPRITPSNTSAEVTVSKPSGLCEGLRSSQITYEFKVYRSNSLVTTENVTTSGPTATATLSGLSISTEYRVEIRGIINVVSQSMPVSLTFSTLPDVDECSSNTTNNCSHFCNNTIGGYICSCPNGYILASNNFTCKREELPTTSPQPSSSDVIAAAVGGAVGGLVVVILIVVIIVIVVFFCIKSRSNSIKDNGRMPMSSRSREERANLTDDTYASPGTEKPQPENTDGVYSYAVTETKIGAQLKERGQHKQKPPPGDFYEEPNAAKNPKHKQGTITGEVYTEPEKPKRGTKKGKQQQPPVSHKEAPAGDLYAMPDKKKDVSHTTGPVTGEEYALASKPKDMPILV